MATSTTTTREPRGTVRLRAEILEGMRDLHRRGLVDDDRLRKTTLRILGRDAFPKLETLTPAAIRALREQAGLSQGVMAGYLNVAVNTIGQWERGERRPTGAALKLLHLARRFGVAMLLGEAVAPEAARRRRLTSVAPTSLPTSRARPERSAA